MEKGGFTVQCFSPSVIAQIISLPPCHPNPPSIRAEQTSPAAFTLPILISG